MCGICGFQIFIKKAKKNRISIWICAVVLTFSIGTMAGCSTTKENAENVSDQPESENIMSVEDSTADNDILENTTVPESSEEKVEKEDKIVLNDERAWFKKHPQWLKSNRYAELEVWIFI